jgi:acyl carrier protein
MITELTAEQRLENIFLTLDSLDRFEVYMMLEELRDENIHSQRLADYGLDQELLLEIGVDKIIAQMDVEWNNSNT